MGKIRFEKMSEVWLKRVALLALAAVLLGAISRLAYPDLDMFHEMALFREALATGWLPRADVFSYIPTKDPIIHHEWGTGAVLYLVSVAAGLGAAGLMILKYVLVAVIALGCYAYARLRGASLPVFVCLALVGIGLGWGGFTTIRAQVFTLLFLVAMLFCLEEDRKGRRWWIAAWLPLYVVWLNLHAGFLVGVGLFFLYTLERLVLELVKGQSPGPAFRQVRHLIAVWLAMILLVSVNPYGLEYVTYLRNAVLLNRTALIPEWRPLWQQLDQNYAFVFLYVVSVALIVYAVSQAGVQNLPGLVVVLATACLALCHFRHLSIYALVWTACVPAYVEGTKLGQAIRQTWKDRKTLLFWFFLALWVWGTSTAIYHRFWELRLATTVAEEKAGVMIYPSGVVQYLSRHKFAGNVMVPYNAGAYVSWKLYPQVKVSMDSRYEVAYAPEAALANERFYGALEGWQEILERFPTDAVLIPRSSPMERIFRATNRLQEKNHSAGWKEVYVDDGYAFFVRRELAERFPVVDGRGKAIPADFP